MILGDNTYYVSSSTTNDCPKQCHPLSYYVTNTATYFTSNATFIFMEGEHLLDSKGLVQVVINNADNLTLRGERGRRQSNTGIIIRCSNNTRGLEFIKANVINIYDITITGCGQQDIPPLLFNTITSIYIQHITLAGNIYYAGSMLCIYCCHIAITKSIFTNNTGALNVSIGTAYMYYSDIANSIFSNSICQMGSGLQVRSMAAAPNSITSNNVITIINSTFANTVGNQGGGLYIQLENSMYNNVTIVNSLFSNNKFGNGGGLYIRSLHFDTHNNITIINSTFTNNAFKKFGGGLVILYGTNIITIANSTFTCNTGNGFFLQFANCNNIVVVSQITVSNNNGSGIAIMNNAKLTFTEGHSIIANNISPTDGGGIYLGKDCYLIISNGGYVSFINNTAHRYGGAIYSADNDHKLLKANVASDNLCTMTSTDYDKSTTFINNSATRAGNILYGGTFIFCSRVHYNVNLVKRVIQIIILSCPTVPITGAHDSHVLSHVSSDPLLVCPCMHVSDTLDCLITSLRREVYPGQILSISLVTVGLCGGVSPGAVVASTHDKQIDLISSATTNHTSTSCATFSYIVKLNSYISHAMVNLSVADTDIQHISVHLSILPCPIGLMVNFSSGDCVCNNNITQVSHILCDISWMPYPIQRSGNNWLSHQCNDYNCTIAHTGCPFDYCNTLPVKFALNQSDLQCNYNRSGILCGKCIQGLSLMIGSNRCANCTDTNLIAVSILIIAAVAGIVLVILLMVLNLTVSVGSINGLLFYANIVKLNESVFFSQGNIPVVTQFISWYNLDIRI